MRVAIDIEPGRPGMSWEESFRHNLEALEWAIKNAPAAHMAPLVGAKSLVMGLARAAQDGGTSFLTTVTVPLYDGYGSQMTIVLEEIVSWTGIEYNGRPGSRIYLRNSGQTVYTDLTPWRLEEAIKRVRQS